MHKIFESNPTLKKAFITSDETAFYQETDAKNHAKTLEDKSIEPVYYENELQVIDQEELTDEEKEMAAFEKAEKEAKSKEELTNALLEFDSELTKYNDALKLFKALGLSAENEKKDTIYPLLVEAKAKTQEGINTPE